MCVESIRHQKETIIMHCPNTNINAFTMKYYEKVISQTLDQRSKIKINFKRSIK